jgi:hypothetical protein
MNDACWLLAQVFSWSEIFIKFMYILAPDKPDTAFPIVTTLSYAILKNLPFHNELFFMGVVLHKELTLYVCGRVDTITMKFALENSYILMVVWPL